MQVQRISYHVKGLVSLNDYALRLAHMIQGKAKKRLKILSFWEKYGLRATMDAFPVKRSALFLWKKRVREKKGRIEALNDTSRAPRARRTRIWPQVVINEVKRLRFEHPNLGKDKLYVLLTPYCDERSLPLPSCSTIGRLIKDLGGLRICPQKVTHYGKVVARKKRKVLRKPKGLKAAYPGHVVALDTIEKFINGTRRYVITFEDIYTRFSFALATSSHASKAAKEFFDYARLVFPYPFTFVLTDNGSEFAKHFSQRLKELHLTHYHTYPRTPKMNAHCERFNRTIQEEYIDYHIQELLDTVSFNMGLMDWLLWYNTTRPHWGINLLSPMQFMLSSQSLTPRESKVWWTNTTT